MKNTLHVFAVLFALSAVTSTSFADWDRGGDRGAYQRGVQAGENNDANAAIGAAAGVAALGLTSTAASQPDAYQQQETLQGDAQAYVAAGPGADINNYPMLSQEAAAHNMDPGVVAADIVNGVAY